MDIPSYILGRIKGSGGAGVNYVVVDELPTIGEEGTIYLVPKSTSKTNNYYDEYMYISNAWELIGDTQADLTDYVKNTDYANTSTGGVIKSSTSYGSTVESNGVFRPLGFTHQQYQNASSGIFINKQTLENVIDGKGLITQYSTIPTASADNVGKIVQFTGTTDSTYTNGYFYKCVSDGQATPTYSWEAINVQNNSVAPYIEDGTGARMYIAKYSTDSTYQQNTLIPILQELLSHSNYSLYLDGGNAQNYDHYTETYYGGIYKLSNNLTNSAIFVCITPVVKYRDLTNLGYSSSWKSATKINATKTSGNITSITFGKDEITIFNGIGTNSYYEKSYNPTQPYNPTSKSYVDDNIILKAYQLAGLSEYSSSSTYAIGDYVYYNKLIYKCSTTVETAEAFDDTKWTQKTYMEYMSDTLVGTALGGSY